MSSEIIDVEVNVVSSPEQSRSGSVDRQSHSPQPPSSTMLAVGSATEGSHHSSCQNNSTSVNISGHHQPHHSYPHPTAAHQLSNHHHHSSNSAESNQSSPGSKPSPPSTKCDPKKTTTTTPSGYTSFSISSILSRNEPKKDVIFPSLPLLPLHHSPEDLHNSAMFSRYEERVGDEKNLLFLSQCSRLVK